MPQERLMVAVKIKPKSSLDQRKNDSGCIESVNGTLISMRRHEFKFDFVFGESHEQSQIFNETTLHLIDKFIEGVNATVIMYGQTGSGKTFTMGTNDSLRTEESRRGLLPRAIREIFKELNALELTNQGYKSTLLVKFVELYNEQVVNLLTIESKADSGIAVDSETELLELLAVGIKARTTGKTLMNDASSRSHAIITLILKQQFVGSDNTVTEERVSKFNFVDLAGSERLKHADGKRKKEGIMINQGLFVLGKVISALSDSIKCKGYIPYRDSKLTTLLHDSLGGDSKTLILACISQDLAHSVDTFNTLSYATKARRIKNYTNQHCKLADTIIPANKQNVHLDETRKDEILSQNDYDLSILRQSVEKLNQELLAAKLRIDHLESMLDISTSVITKHEFPIRMLEDETFEILCSSCFEESIPDISLAQGIKECREFVKPPRGIMQYLPKMYRDDGSIFAGKLCDSVLNKFNKRFAIYT